MTDRETPPAGIPCRQQDPWAQALITAALEAQDRYELDDLEAYAAAWRRRQRQA